MKHSTLGSRAPSIRMLFSAFSEVSCPTGLIEALQFISFVAGIVLLLAASISSTAQAASFPTQKLFYYQHSSPTLIFQTGQAGCEYIASQSRDGNGFYTLTNPLWVPNDPTYGHLCQFIAQSSPTSPPQPTSQQDVILPMADSCPQGYAASSGVCACTDATLCPKAPPTCEADGNPILRGYGIKRQVETDYTSASSLRFERTYNSVQSANDSRLQWTADVQLGGFGRLWLHTYSRVIDLVTNGTLTSVLAYRPNGGLLVFQQNGSSWVPETDVADTLTQQTDGSGNLIGWTYHIGATEETEIYNSKGTLQSITDRAGITQILNYSTSSTPFNIAPAPNFLINVTDSFGRQLNFTYDRKTRITSMTDPSGGRYLYTYNGYSELATVQYPDNKTRSYLYDESAYTTNNTSIGALTGITDENGQRFATFTYINNKSTATYHAGNTDKYSFTYGSNQTTVTDPLTTARTYNFQTILGVVKGTTQSQPSGAGCGPSASAVTYDTNGNVASRTDFNGNITNYVYDLTRNLETSRTEAYGTPQARTITTTWHSTYRLPLSISEPGKTTTFTYDASGNLLSKTITDTALSTSRTWTYTYNGLGQVLTADGPRTDVADVTTYTYYASASSTSGSVHSIGDLATVTNAVGHVTSITNYDLNGRPLSITDPNGIVTILAYDPRGRLTSRTVNGVQTTTYTYDGVGQLTQVTLPDNSVLKYTYDTAHRLTDIQDGYLVGGVLTLTGNKIHYTLDAMGNRTQEDTKDPSNNIVKTRSRIFDSLNRLQKEIGGTSPTTQITQYGYDNNGNTTTITDPLNLVTTNGYDALNRLIQITDPNTPTNGVTLNAYNARDQLTQVKDPRLVATNYTVDGLGNVSVTQSPDSGTTNNVYDAAGNLTQKTDARGVVSNYTYDALNRVTSIQYPSNSNDNVSFVYDDTVNTYYRKGRLNSVQRNGGGGTLSFSYDAYGNIVTLSQLTNWLWSTTQYQYDSANRLAQIIYPDERYVIYTRNALGQIYQVQTKLGTNGALQPIVTNTVYEPFGPLKSLTFGNAVTTTFAHDLDYRVARLTTTTSPSWDYVYNYDAAGNLIAETNQSGGPNKSYGYDALNRVNSDANDYGTWTYQYDAGGNRLQSQFGSSAATAQAYASNPVSNRELTYGSNALVIDPAGNITARANLTLSYGAANLPMQATNSNNSGVTFSYLYNGLGWRSQKTNPVTNRFTQYEYLPDGKLLEQTKLNLDDASLVQGVDYIWLDDLPIAQIVTTNANHVTSRRLTYIHTDHLNTPRAMSDSTQAMVWRWSGDAYGLVAPNLDPDGDGIIDTTDLRFAGQIVDYETGLFYNINRYYDPLTGRYISADPIGLRGGANPYVYANDDPVNYYDPNGLQVRSAAQAAGNALGGLLGALTGAGNGSGNVQSIDPTRPYDPTSLTQNSIPKDHWPPGLPLPPDPSSLTTTQACPVDPYQPWDDKNKPPKGGPCGVLATSVAATCKAAGGSPTYCASQALATYFTCLLITGGK